MKAPTLEDCPALHSAESVFHKSPSGALSGEFLIFTRSQWPSLFIKFGVYGLHFGEETSRPEHNPARLR